MLTDRTTRIFFAIALLVIGLMIGLNVVLNAEGLADWAPLAAFAALFGALALYVTVWLEERAASQPAPTSRETPETSLQEWVISKDLLPDASYSIPVETMHISAPAPAETVAEDAPAPAPAPAETVAEDAPAPAPAPAETVAESVPEPVAKEIAEAIANGQEAEIVEAAQVGDLIMEQQIAEAMAADISANDDAEVETPAEVVPEPAAAASAAPAAEAVPDDLKRIEGIGPVYSDVLRAAGITTFVQLAATPRDRLEQILREAGHSRLASIDTWAEQAALAAQNDWDGLAELQSTLKGGRRIT